MNAGAPFLEILEQPWAECECSGRLFSSGFILRSILCTVLKFALLMLAIAGCCSLAKADVFHPAGERALRCVLPERFDLPTSSLEKTLLEDAADGRLDQHGLLEAALIASGLHEREQVDVHLQEFRTASDELKRLSTGQSEQDARVLLEFLHRRFLTSGYDARWSSVAGLMQRGEYNCVSATLLYRCLADAIDLQVTAVQVPGHMHAMVDVGEQMLPVETTCAIWPQTLGPVAALRPAEDGQQRQLNDVQLLAVLYYNSGIELLAAKQYAAAIVANYQALRLDPENTDARGNLRACLNNWALAESSAGNHASAAAILAAGLTIDSAHEVFRTNQRFVYRAWSEELCKRGEYRQAADLLLQLYGREPKSWQTSPELITLYRKWATTLLQAGELQAAQLVLAELRQGFPDDAEALHAEAAAINDAAIFLMQRGRADSALAVLDQGLALQPTCEFLQINRRIAAQHAAKRTAA